MANYKAELPSGERVTIDVPEGEDPKVYIPHAVQMISRGGGGGTNLTGGMGEQIAENVSKFGQGIANFPSAAMDFISKLGSAAMTQPEHGLMTPPEDILPHLLDVAKGVGRGASFGLYNPEATSPEQSARMMGGEVLGAGKSFNAASNALKPVISNAMARVPLLSSLVGALQGGPEGAGQGLATGVAGELGAKAVKGAARYVGSPAEQVLSTEEANTAIRQSNQAKTQAALDDLQLRKVTNFEAAQQYAEQMRNAEADAASQNAAAHEAFMAARKAAELKLAQARNSLDPAQAEISRLQERVQPNAPSKALYEPINAAVEAGIDPSIDTPATSASLKKIGTALSKSTEGLPKAAGASGVAEKIATGMEAGNETPTSIGTATVIDPIRSQLLSRVPADVKSFYGEALDSLDNSTLKNIIDQNVGPIAAATGANIADVMGMTQGKLRIGQADRLLQVFGDQYSNSGLARKFFWDVIGDLKKAAPTEPMAQQLLDARASFRQEIAAKDLAVAASPRLKNGRYIYDPDKIATIFDERNVRPKDVLLRESFDPNARKVIMDTLSNVFHIKESIAAAESELKQNFGKAQAPKPVAAVEPTKPNYVSEEVKAPTLDPELDMKYVSPADTGVGGILKHPILLGVELATAMRMMFGIDLSYSVLAGGIVAIKSIVPDVMFNMALKAAQQPAGRAFLRNLFRNEPPNTFNVDSLSALANYLGIEAARLAAQTGKMGGIAGTTIQRPQGAQ